MCGGKQLFTSIKVGSLKSLELKQKPDLKANHEPDVTTSIDESGGSQSTKKLFLVFQDQKLFYRGSSKASYSIQRRR